MTGVSWQIRYLDRSHYLSDLQRLRSQRTTSVKKGSRGSAYTAALEQAEDLWTAAEGIEPLASPILRYYALTQAALAIAAASPLPNTAWQPGHSHGLKCVVHANNGRLDFSRVLISPEGNGIAQTLAMALESDMVPQDTSLAHLVASLWHRVYGFDEPARPVYPRRPLSVWVHPSSSGGVRVTASADFKEALDADEKQVRAFLAGYPGLSRCRDYEVSWHESGEPWLGLQIADSAPMGTVAEWIEACDVEARRGEPIDGSMTAKVFLPGFGGGMERVHPLLTWFLVLYAFSMLARYHGHLWRRRLNLNEDHQAVDTRLLIGPQTVDAICIVTQVLQGFLHSSPG